MIITIRHGLSDQEFHKTVEDVTKFLIEALADRGPQWPAVVLSAALHVIEAVLQQLDSSCHDEVEAELRAALPIIIENMRHAYGERAGGLH
jgi:hypothetical protein